MSERTRIRGRRSEESRLSVELIPEPTWFRNARSLLPKEDWDVLRRAVYREAGYRCEICGGQGTEYPVAAHEVWEFDDERHIQRLVRLIALCPPCHEVKHIGLAGVMDRDEEAMAHLMEVNRWSRRRAEAHVDRAWDLWERRSRHGWEIVVDWDGLASRYGIQLSKGGLERIKCTPIDWVKELEASRKAPEGAKTGKRRKKG